MTEARPIMLLDRRIVQKQATSPQSGHLVGGVRLAAFADRRLHTTAAEVAVIGGERQCPSGRVSGHLLFAFLYMGEVGVVAHGKRQTRASTVPIWTKRLQVGFLLTVGGNDLDNELAFMGLLNAAGPE